MKRVFYNSLTALRSYLTWTALAVGLCLRLFFVLKFPAGSGDTVLYEQLAANWLQHGVYAMDVAGKITPVDLRMPAYPAFLAMIFALTGKGGEAARLWVMLAQVAVDLLTCVVIGALAAWLPLAAGHKDNSRRIFTAALWFSAICPFIANYTAVPLTEIFATFLTTVALLLLVLLLNNGKQASAAAESEFVQPFTRFLPWQNSTRLALAAGFIIGLATLFRPESPLLLFVAWLLFAGILFLQGAGLRWFRMVLLTGIACALPLLPWAIRNAVTLHKIQFLAPRNAMLPGELDPQGFVAWEKTWLYRVRDCYLVPWKLNDDVINLEDIPSSAFDTPEEKERVAALLEQYNDDLTLSPVEDAVFAQLARERTARHPLRTYLWLPARRALRIWFTPRIELLPVSGHVFPLAYMREEDPVDQSVTAGLFLLNIFYIALAAWGSLRVWRQPAARPALALLITYIVLRTAFLTTLEAPEPRYVLVCFPAIIALAAQVFTKRSNPK